MEKTLLIGASGLAREVLALTRAGSSHVVFGVLDDGWADIGETFAGVPVLGAIERAVDYIDTKLLICIGAGTAREAIVDRLALLGVGTNSYTTLIDPTVNNNGGCPVGSGSIVLAHVVLTADVSVGAHVVIMPNVTLTHDDVVDDFATIAAGVTFGGNVRIGRGAYIGMNASVRQRVNVGDYGVLGMGAALLNTLPKGETWVGVPARNIRTGATGESPASFVQPSVAATPLFGGAEARAQIGEEIE